MSPPKDIDSVKEELKKVKEQIQEYEQENTVLQKILNETKVNSMEKYAKIVQVALYSLVLIIGIGISWGVMNSKLANAALAAEKVEQLEDRIRGIEIKSSANDEVLLNIRSDLVEIKAELKKINSKGQ